MIRVFNILVATDFDDASNSALEYGVELARTFGARLHVLHVVENGMVAVGPECVGLDFGQLQAELERTSWRKLSGLIPPTLRNQLDIVRSLRIAPKAAPEIVSYACDNSIDLIVTGTHGRGPVGHLLMGSVAEAVVRRAPCPVLTVKRTEKEFVWPDAVAAIATPA